MAYQALYRKLRPQRFEDVAGQEHITRTLQNQIENKRINHAYLFCGTRGTGKTTTAKIFARAINCRGEGTKPCNKCDTCVSIQNGRNVNVIEIDAASNNGVDNVRDIIEEVKYPPTDCDYKVYIIDEVHMLSPGAFNALLKTLEEPPEYVVFILATTDPQKMPVTVLSRCQRFDFHRIDKEIMVRTLKKYMEDEEADVTDEAIEYIADISDGAMRDALSVLDQCISFYSDSKVTLDRVEEITGSVDRSVFFELTDAMNNNDGGKCMDIIDKVVLQGRDINRFTADLISHLRNILLAVSTDGKTKVLDYSASYNEKLKKQGMEVGYDYAMSLITSFSELANKIRFSTNPRVLLEVCVLKGCSPTTASDYGSMTKRLRNIETKLEEGIPARAQAAEISVMPEKTPAEEKKDAAPESEESPKKEETDNKTTKHSGKKSRESDKKAPEIKKAVPDDIKKVIGQWKKFLSVINEPVFRSMVGMQSWPAYLEDGFLTIVALNNGALKYIDNHVDEIQKYLEDYFHMKIEINAMREDRYNIRHQEKYGVKDTGPKEFTKKDFEKTFGKGVVDYED